MKKSTLAILLLVCPFLSFMLNFIEGLITKLPELFAVFVSPVSFPVRIFCPIIHFCIIGFLLDKEHIKGITAVLFALLYPVCDLLGFICGLLLNKDFSIDNILTFMVLVGVYETICAVLLLGNIAIRKKLNDEQKLHMMLLIESIVVLILFVLAPYFTVRMEWPEFLDWYGAMELYVMGWGIGMLSIFSFVLGCMMSQRLRMVKLLTWSAGVIAAVFFGLVFMDRKCDFLAFFNVVEITIWAIISVTVIVSSLIGVLVKRKMLQNVKNELV